jgi:hypothetical protein
MAATTLIARRASGRDVPIWNVFACGSSIGSLTNLPRERAWCLTARYCGRLLDFRAASREAVLLALRCAVDAIDHAMDQDEADGWVEDEDGDLAAQRAAERRAEDYAMRREHEEPWF